MPAKNLRVALAHDWLTGMRGGEKVLEVFCELFPDAPIYTLLHNPGSVSPTIERHRVETSFIQKLPRVATKYRNYLPLFPTAIETFNMAGYDLILSSSHCVAKGIVPHAGTTHICYIHTPMRYVYEMYDQYFGPGRAGKLKRLLVPFFANYLRTWDMATTHRVDHFVANSENVRRRIQRHYRREATVIPPPVDTARFSLSEKLGDYYLVVSALVPYKRVELAVQAAGALGRRLVLVGTGPEMDRLKHLSAGLAKAGKPVEFIGWQSDDQLREWYANCAALLFPGEEDFGIVPLEAQACGKPVIAFGRGGALETVVEGQTGLFFKEQTVESLVDAMKRFEEQRDQFAPAKVRANALRFDRAEFKRRVEEFVRTTMGV
jgi:glycosyltransferase involved in cell wall biosynthesis